MKISIVIISHNSGAMLQRCLLSLAEVMQREDVELIWVDNGSTDGSERAVKKLIPNALRLLLPRNMGVALARNRGVKLASGEYVLFLDDDTEANSAAISAMEKHLDANATCALAAVALRDKEGNLQDSFKKYPGIAAKVGNVVRGFLRIKRKAELPDGVQEPCYVIGACQMFRRRAYDAVGGLDENIFYGPEDADFCIRLRAKGWQIAYLPSESIVHHWRRATTLRPFSSGAKAHFRGLTYFWRKHRRWL